MRALTLAPFAATVAAASASFGSLSPYIDPLEYSGLSLNLFKRQGCPGGYTNCGALGNSGACCPTDQACARDADGNVACCPIGAACTGTLGETATGLRTDSSTGSILLGGATSTSAVLTPSEASTTSGFLFPSATTDAAPSLTGSTVPDAVFPFVFIPTTFSNAAECSSYATSCSDQYQSCLAALGGGVNGVTVSGANVGITVQGASTTVAEASSACSSLSQRACYGLQTNICPRFGGGTATGTGAFSIDSGSRPRVTGCPGMMYALGAGAMAGAAGVLV